MQIVGCAAVLLALAAASPAAAFEQARANPARWQPADARAGDPIDVVLTLSGPGPRADDVEVVLRGNGEERRFAAVPLGSGRYRTTVAFPYGGGWTVDVSYRVHADGRRAEVPLGKGASWVAGPPPPRETQRAAPATRPATAAALLALALCLSVLALVASRSANRGSPARPG